MAMEAGAAAAVPPAPPGVPPEHAIPDKVTQWLEDQLGSQSTQWRPKPRDYQPPDVTGTFGETMLPLIRMIQTAKAGDAQQITQQLGLLAIGRTAGGISVNPDAESNTGSHSSTVPSPGNPVKLPKEGVQLIQEGVDLMDPQAVREFVRAALHLGCSSSAHPCPSVDCPVRPALHSCESGRT
eukprot:Hpha_TRINITY_DN22677_c0_g1::TRINITY_DN22677_c0_g1_i1::g.192715::m.192715